MIYVASRQQNNPKSIKHILQVTNTQSKDISSCYKKIKEIIPEAKVQTQASQIAISACNRLSLPQDVIMASKFVAEAIT